MTLHQQPGEEEEQFRWPFASVVIQSHLGTAAARALQVTMSISFER